MRKPAGFALCICFIITWFWADQAKTQEIAVAPQKTAELTQAEQFDAKDLRKLTRIRKLDELRRELAASSTVGEGTFQKMEQSLTAFLEDPESDDVPRYDLLIQLGDLHMRRQEKGSKLKSIHYLHMAAIEDPGRVEAYLRLAQLYSDLGESQEQIKYLNMAHEIVASAARYNKLADIHRKQGEAEKFAHYKRRAENVPKSFEAWYLLGQYYLERSNFYAVLTALRPVAFDKHSYYQHDPYLINQMYRAATLDMNTFRYWAPPLYATMIGLTPSQLEKRIEDRFGSAPDLDFTKTVLAYLWSEDLLSYLRNAIDVSSYYEVEDRESGKPVFRLKPVALGWGSPRSPLKFDKNLEQLLPEFFVRASVSSSLDESSELQARKEEQVKVLKKRLEDLKKTASEKFGGISDPEQKAKALFVWLKQDVLKNYALVEGIPAENVLNPDKKKYLCLTGAIMYTFLGRHLGLDVVGCLSPGHAYCRFNHNGRSMIVETTDNAGFDMSEGKLHASGERRGGILFSEKPEGPVTPWELVSCQFMNVAMVQPKLLIFEKPEYAELARKAFGKLPSSIKGNIKQVREGFERKERSDEGFKWEKEFTAKDCMDTWFLTPLGTVPRLGTDLGNVIEVVLVRSMIEMNPDFQKDALAKYEEALDVLARGLQMEPFSSRFRTVYVGLLEMAQDVDSGPQRAKLNSWVVKLKDARKELNQAIQDLKKASEGRDEQKGEKPLAQAHADARSRAEAKIEKYSSVGEAAAREAVDLGEALMNSLERRKAAMRYCPPIPELRQEYFRFVNSLYRHLADVETFCDNLMKLPGSPEHIRQTKSDVAALRDKVGALAWGVD